MSSHSVVVRKGALHTARECKAQSGPSKGDDCSSPNGHPETPQDFWLLKQKKSKPHAKGKFQGKRETLSKQIWIPLKGNGCNERPDEKKCQKHPVQRSQGYSIKVFTPNLENDQADEGQKPPEIPRHRPPRGEKNRPQKPPFQEVLSHANFGHIFALYFLRHLCYPFPTFLFIQPYL